MELMCVQMTVEATIRATVLSTTLSIAITFRVITTMEQVVICLDVRRRLETIIPTHQSVFVDVAHLVSLVTTPSLHALEQAQ